MWPNPQFPANLVIFTEEILDGKLQFLSVRNMANTVMNDKWFKDKISSNLENETKRIVTTAATWIKSQIKEKSYGTGFNPLNPFNRRNKWFKRSITSYLNLFMETLFSCNLNSLVYHNVF